MVATQYPTLIQSLDSFITDVIETSTHLQNLEVIKIYKISIIMFHKMLLQVDTTLPKERQKFQAKNILQQKHRSLADLFKTLTHVGLSFRSGVIDRNLKNHAADFYIKPLDLEANFSCKNNR